MLRGMPIDKSARACLRCRLRKTRCTGGSYNGSQLTRCLACEDADVVCEMVAHRRGRKTGTRLSTEVRERLRRKQPAQASTSTGNARENHSVGSALLIPPEASIPNDSQALSSASHHRAINLSHAEAGDIGPTVRGASSIERLFAPRSLGPAARDPAAVYRCDPIGYGYVDEALARDLFAFFMTVMSQYLFIFDPDLHTYEYVFETSSFLFSVIITVAAKYNSNVPSLVYKRCLALAKSQISKVFTDDFKDEEAVIALFTMTEYKEASDENGYLLLGIACRLCVDLELHTPVPHYDPRRNRSRTRIWLALYAADRRYNYCGQTAKPTMMPDHDLMLSSENFRQSHLCLASDWRLAGNVKLRRILSTYIEIFDGRIERTGSDVSHKTLYHNLAREVDCWRAEEQETVDNPVMLTNIASYTLHAKVVIAHRWVREAFREVTASTNSRAAADERREALSLCVQGSVGILSHMLEMPDESFRYCGDSKHLYYAYASLLLYKTLKTETATQVLDSTGLAHLFTIVVASADKMDRAALALSHTGAYHANFLRSLIDFQAPEPNLAESWASKEPITSDVFRLGAQPEVPLLGSAEISAFERAEHACHPPSTVGLNIYGQPSHQPFDDTIESNNMLWDDWWPLDNSLLDQGTFDTLANNEDDELQDILGSLFQTSAPAYD